MNRRDIVLALAALGAAPLAARAQQGRRIPVIGFLHPGSPGAIAGPSSVATGLRDGLRDIGYLEGENIKIEYRWAQGKPDMLPALAHELVGIKVDLIVAVSPASVRAAKAATRDLPIVAHDLETDPVASGLVASLARPGGNMTGLFLDLPDMAAKWLQLVREAVPGVRRVAVLWDANTGESQLRAITPAAKATAVELQILEYRDLSGMAPALESSLKARPQALVLLGSPLINRWADRVAGFAARHRLPGISPFRSFAERGGLMSYGVNLVVMYRGLAPIIAKILKGSRPGDLPIEQPTHFEFIVNLKAAKALGLAIPGSLLLRADEVIE